LRYDLVDQPGKLAFLARAQVAFLVLGIEREQQDGQIRIVEVIDHPGAAPLSAPASADAHLAQAAGAGDQAAASRFVSDEVDDSFLFFRRQQLTGARLPTLRHMAGSCPTGAATDTAEGEQRFHAARKPRGARLHLSPARRERQEGPRRACLRLLLPKPHRRRLNRSTRQILPGLRARILPDVYQHGRRLAGCGGLRGKARMRAISVGFQCTVRDASLGT
jgi:hypothetical protein